MFSQRLQLVCSILGMSFVRSIHAQAAATASENGIVSAAGGPEATQAVSYSIIGGGSLGTATGDATGIASVAGVPTSTATDASVIEGTDSRLSGSKDHGLTIPAILAITLAVVFTIVGILILVIVIHKRRRQVVGQAKRKSIMDVEFATSKSCFQHVNTEKSGNIGYFDVAKPLPAVIEKAQPARPIEDDRLSRSSTLIADAAEIAQINRKASLHQANHKKSREQQRERNHALHILITNEDNRTSVLPHSPLTSNPTTPVDPEPVSPRECTDGNGDAFAKRPSKI